MSEGWEPEELERVNNGLSLVGWLFVGSPSADDALLLAQVAFDALTNREAGTLTAELAHNLAKRAYEILWPYVGGSEYRAAVVSDHYSRSSRLAPFIPLIDEATLAYYRGYWTVALAGFFILAEAYLRVLAGWQPGGPPASFKSLQQGLLKFPASAHRTRAQSLVGGIYSYYDSLDPPTFFFNRHGLLHGLRGPQEADRVNCARMFVLLDALVSAELGKGFSGYVSSPSHEERLRMYASCVHLGVEKRFLKQA